MLAAEQYDALRALLMESVEAAIAQEKGPTETTRRAAAKRIIKSAEKNAARNTALHGAWTVDDKQYICDGYKCLEFNAGNHINGLPATENTYGPNVFNDLAPVENTVEVWAEDVKKALARWKADGKPGTECLYRVGNAVFNAQYLLDVLQACGLTMGALNVTGQLKAAYITGDTFRAVVLPIRAKEDAKTYGEAVTA